MNSVFSSLSRLIKVIFDLPHKLFSFPHKSRTDDRGVFYASQFRRSLSIIIDLFFCIFLLKVVGYFISFFMDLHFPVEVLERYRFNLPITHVESALMMSFYKKVILVQIFQLVLLSVIFVFSWYRFASTPGKWIFALRVLDDSTLQKASLFACIKRLVMLPVSLGVLFLGMLWSIFDRKSRTWHDIFAGTVVVYANKGVLKKKG